MRTIPTTLLTLLALAAPVASQEPEIYELTPAAEAEIETSLTEAREAEAAMEAALAALREKREALETRMADGADEMESRSADSASAEARIVNGVRTSAFATTGALIQGATADSAGSWCSGTLIGCRTFLTANHCVNDDRRPEMYHVYLQNGGIHAVEAISERHPEYDFPHADVALVRLATEVEGIEPTPIHVGPAIPSGTPGTLVGFGRSGGLRNDYGIKRVGEVRTAACTRPETTLLCWDFDAPVGLPGEDSNTCNADSGGPLFVDLGGGLPTVVAGITSGGTRSDCLAGDHSYDVDIRQFAQFVEEFSGDDLTGGACGDLPAVGTPGAQVLSASGELEAGSSRHYRLVTSAGLGELRVAVNGEDDGATDLNLYVRRGDIATPTENDCAQDGSGTYAYCAVENPEPGDWFLHVEQAGTRAGVFQVTVTLLDGQP